MNRRVGWSFAALLTGCSGLSAFQIDDVAKLELGRSSRLDVDKTLGAPVASLDRSSVYESSFTRVLPPFPAVLVSWPVFFSRRDEKFYFFARFDERDVLAEGSLTISGFQDAFFFVLIHPHGPLQFQEEVDRKLLGHLEKKGIKVWLRRGYTPVDQSMERYRPGD